MLEVRLLGKFDICVDGLPVEIPLRAAQSLLAYLMLTPGTAHRREQLAGLLWPDMPESNAKGNLRHTLWRIRKALGECDYLLADDITVAFDATTEYWLDAALVARRVEADASADDLMRTVSAYGGDLLPGFYDEWVVLERQRLQAAFEDKMALLMDRLVEAGRWQEILEWAERWIALGHTPEAAYRALIIAHASRGDVSSAAAAYKRCVEALREELGVEPSAQTRVVFERLSKGEVLPGEALPEPVGIVKRRRSNLPSQLSSFIGRERELEEVRRLLSESRLVTLTGPGGVGKTRLSLQVGADVGAEYPHGVWLVELAPLSSPALVPQTVATTLGVREEPGYPLIKTLTDFLRPKALLLIVDNCEHVIEACAQLAETLLRACPNMKILATSREALRITGETSFLVPSLSLPDVRPWPGVEMLAPSEAARLFIERAVAVKPDFSVTDANALAVAQICHRLDGIPLALELAAARARAMTVEHIATRLDDRFRLLTGGSRTALPRHQTLSALIDWSYGLLSEAERALFRRLSVFAGGFTLQATESVCKGEGIEEDQIFDLLLHLVDKSLVIAGQQNGETRYRMLETIREYAREQLLAAGEEARVRGEHLDFFVRIAEEAEPRLYDAGQVAWMDRLEAEHDNLRAALAWSLGGGQAGAETGLRLAGALGHFWFVRGYWSEGREWLERTLAKAGSGVSTRAKALYRAGFIAYHQADPERTAALAKESLALCREAGDQEGLAFSFVLMGEAAWSQGDMRQAEALYKDSLALFREVGHKWGMLYAVIELAWIAYHYDNFEQAKALAEECLALSRELGDKWSIANSLNVLGRVVRVQGDYERAEALHKESLALSRELGVRLEIGYTLGNLGRVARDQGDYERAVALYEQRLALFRELGAEVLIAWSLRGLGTVAWRQGDYRRATTLL
ncbi:MAG TPA: tetratricopeptide repeat protein, partial [Anaerolineae bacterium]|nr:tetratricopeptide repeat protein [Anaerolineae bacterium]